jgi:excisionase family DNA binding protein
LKYLTIDQVAIYLQVSKPTIYLWVKRNKIPYIRKSQGIIRFDKDSIDAFMKGSETTPKNTEGLK